MNLLFDWYTSDQHYGHTKIVDKCGRRFSSVEHMDSEMIRRYREVVRPGDRVAFLGDFSFSGPQRTVEIMSQLPGQKFLIRGNHDRMTTALYQRAGFSLVVDQLRATIRGVETILVHYHPIDFVSVPYDGRVKYLESLPLLGDRYACIHGHTHSRKRTHRSAIHVGVDAWDFYPAPGGEVERLVESMMAKERMR